MEDLALDLDDIITKTEGHIDHFKQRVQTLASTIASKESQKALKQAENIARALRILWLTSGPCAGLCWCHLQSSNRPRNFLHPLSFVAASFGMNVTQLSPQRPTPVWVYFLVATPVTLILGNFVRDMWRCYGSTILCIFLIFFEKISPALLVTT